VPPRRTRTRGRGAMRAPAVRASRRSLVVNIFDGGFRRDDGFERVLRRVRGATGVFWEACVGVASYRVARIAVINH